MYYLKALLIIVLAAVLASCGEKQTTEAPPGAQEPCGVTVGNTQDLDQIVNGDPKDKVTAFCLLEGPYPLSETAILGPGDTMRGQRGTFRRVGPAYVPQPTTKITNGANLSILIQTDTDVRLSWFDVSGASARFVGGEPQPCDKPSTKNTGCPLAGTGANIKNPDVDGVRINAVYSHHAAAVGINGGARITRSEIAFNSTEPAYKGFTASGIKTDEEHEVGFSFLHDNAEHALWCDQGCDDAPTTNGYWMHDNVIVKNGGYGIRYEFSPQVEDGSGSHLSQPTALLQANYILGNGNAGASVRDAQNSKWVGNVFGGATVEGVAYDHNKAGSAPVAIMASDSGRVERTDLWNTTIDSNTLNGEKLVGCDLPDEVVLCTNNTP